MWSLLYGIQDVYVVPVKPSPEANTVMTKVISSRPYENKQKTPINVPLRFVGVASGGNHSKNGGLKTPYLTYNEPQGRCPAFKPHPILLDFSISNGELAPAGYKVVPRIDEKKMAPLSKDVPYYIYNFSPGKHTVKIELLDNNNNIVSGFFNVIE